MPRHTLIFTVLMMFSHPAVAEPHVILDIKKFPKPGETVVWSPLFQASWEKMQSLHAGKMAKVEPPNTIISRLEKFQWKKEDVMPKDGYALFAGPSTPEFAKATAQKIKEQFGVDMTPSRLPTNPRGNAIYGILLRDLNFKKQFYRSRKRPLRFIDSTGSSHEVSFFGTAKKNSAAYQKHVQVLTYKKAEKSFILSVDTDKLGEKIIIYRPIQRISFRTAIENVLDAKKSPLAGHWGSEQHRYIHENDIVKIPYLTLKTDTDLTKQLNGRRYYENEKNYSITSMAYQVTHFNLSEKGAKIQIQTGMDDAFGGAPLPRQFICDAPFFVFAWRDKASHPYFAAWIDGKEALEAFTP